MSTIIVHGGQSQGKSSVAPALMRRFDCSVLVDGWDGRSALPKSALVLTNLPPTEFRTPAGATSIEFVRALGLL